jgi:hypothetical protein
MKIPTITIMKVRFCHAILAILGLSCLNTNAEPPSTSARQLTPTPKEQNANSAETAPRIENLEVKCDKAAYRSGDTLVVTIKVPKDGFLRVYSLFGDGELLQIFPNRYEQTYRVKAGQVVTLPGHRDPINAGKIPAYDLMVNLPEGETQANESVHAILSTEDFQDKENFNFLATAYGPFKSHGKVSPASQVNPATLASRGLSPTARATALQGAAQYSLIER